MLYLRPSEKDNCAQVCRFSMAFGGFSGTVRVVIVLLVGVATIGYGAYSYSVQSSALDTATEVNATITDTAVETNDGKGVTYTPQATFTYTYEGETYTSSNVYPGELPREFGSREDASAELNGYESGETVTAYVPPDAPGNAFLKYESTDKPFLVIGFGVLVVLGAARSALKR